ncbi:putative Cystatin domain-containing protein [Medicago truncatula]|uniref:Cystatin domain protein n=2 Tax=Medicago truncatula TaxID=3880 RepID=G7LGA9_MEDTR|nr:cystatin domain protein [Medicago truncatula]RHN42221.1 putative Cystatin domain-containing protein [Medicago truncatula]
MRLESMVLVLVVLLAFTATKQAIPIGNLSPINNINDPKVIDVANFAVKEYNNRRRKPEEKLRLWKVIKGESQIVADGVNYRLTLSATKVYTSNTYEAIVLEWSLQHLRNLTSFKLIQA